MRDNKYNFDNAGYEKMKANKRHLYLPDINKKPTYTGLEEQKASVIVEETVQLDESSQSEEDQEIVGLDNEMNDLNYLADAMLRLGGREDSYHPEDAQLMKLMDIRLFILL